MMSCTDSLQAHFSLVKTEMNRSIKMKFNEYPTNLIVNASLS